MTDDGRRMIAGLVRGCHPGPTVAVTALVTTLAAAAGHGAAGCLLVGLAVLSGQLSIGWCNDAADAGRDAAAGRADKPAVDGTITPRALWIAAAVALGCCVPLSFASGLLAGSAHLAGVLAAWAYDLGLKATLLSWVPYAAGFGVLPAFVTLGLPEEPWPAWWATAAAALLGVGAHLANVLPDLADDLATGVRGWPQRLGVARLRALLPLPLLAATCLLAFGPTTTTPPTSPSTAEPSAVIPPSTLVPSAPTPSTPEPSVTGTSAATPSSSGPLVTESSAATGSTLEPLVTESSAVPSSAVTTDHPSSPGPHDLSAAPLDGSSPSAPASTDPSDARGTTAYEADGPAFAGLARTSLMGWIALATAAFLAAAGLLLARSHPRVPFAAAIAVAGVDVALLLTGGASLTG